MTRVLVTGGRNFRDRVLMDQTLDPYRNRSDVLSRKHTIIHGGAKGADELADEWAKLFCVPVESFPADWAAHGKAAGPIRNGRMIAEGKPDLVLAFSGGRGTADCVRQAQAAGIPIVRVGATTPRQAEAAAIPEER